MATGLLIVCVENATKHVSSFQSLDKEYRVEVKLGARTASDDAETPEEEINDIQHLHSTAILATINRFIGTFEQIPPNYSAIHVSGKRAYELARQGLNVPLSPRIVTVHAIDDVNIALPFVRMTVRCSKGTYIRALARDIGNALGVGAYVTDLRRTAIGNYRVEDAFTLRELAYYLHSKSHADLPVSR
jgi:tRNA pseudouridine55 synthase